MKELYDSETATHNVTSPFPRKGRRKGYRRYYPFWVDTILMGDPSIPRIVYGGLISPDEALFLVEKGAFVRPSATLPRGIATANLLGLWINTDGLTRKVISNKLTQRFLTSLSEAKEEFAPIQVGILNSTLTTRTRRSRYLLAALCNRN